MAKKQLKAEVKEAILSTLKIDDMAKYEPGPKGVILEPYIVNLRVAAVGNFANKEQAGRALIKEIERHIENLFEDDK